MTSHHLLVHFSRTRCTMTMEERKKKKKEIPRVSLAQWLPNNYPTVWHAGISTDTRLRKKKKKRKLREKWRVGYLFFCGAVESISKIRGWTTPGRRAAHESLRSIITKMEAPIFLFFACFPPAKFGSHVFARCKETCCIVARCKTSIT